MLLQHETLHAMKSIPLYSLASFILAAALPLQTQALLLDCEINPDKTYTCIEISNADSPESPEDTQSYGDEYSGYIDEAKRSCVYREPRKRPAGKVGGSAQRTEELKSARKDYENCISDKARALWRQHNSPAQAAD